MTDAGPDFSRVEVLRDECARRRAVLGAKCRCLVRPRETQWDL